MATNKSDVVNEVQTVQGEILTNTRTIVKTESYSLEDINTAISNLQIELANAQNIVAEIGARLNYQKALRAKLTGGK